MTKPDTHHLQTPASHPSSTKVNGVNEASPIVWMYVCHGTIKSWTDHDKTNIDPPDMYHLQLPASHQSPTPVNGVSKATQVVWM